MHNISYTIQYVYDMIIIIKKFFLLSKPPAILSASEEY